MGLALVGTSSWCYQVVKMCLPFSFISPITFKISIHLAAADYLFIAFTCYACLYSGVVVYLTITFIKRSFLIQVKLCRGYLL